MSGKLIPGDELSTEMDKIIASLDLAQAQKTWSEQWQAGHPEWEEPHATQGGFLTLDNGDVVGFFSSTSKTGNRECRQDICREPTHGRSVYC